MKGYLSFATVLLATMLFVQCAKPQTTAGDAPAAEPTQEDLVKRGEYMVTILGCHDCHSPKKMGPQGPELIPELMLSGYPADRPLGKVTREAIAEGWALFNSDLTLGVGPWGATFAANITSDESGIGNWTLEQFTRALTQGKSKGMEDGRMLLPPMPWFNYANMDKKDVEAIYAYLKSTKPVRNLVPAPIALDALPQ